MGTVQNDVRKLQAPIRVPLTQTPRQRQPNPYQYQPQPNTPIDLPLTLGHLGSVSSDRMFDDKVSVQEDFRFNGHKNGYVWKSKIERYIISTVLALAKIFHWAEQQEVEITDALLRQTFGDR